MRRTAAALLLAAAAALTGCSPGPGLVAVEGTLIGPDGKPMADVLVQFAPDAPGGKALGSSAVTDAAGTFVLTADDGRPGAVPGPHRVTLVDSAFTADDDATLGKANRLKRVNRVPKPFSEPTATPLKVTVESSKKRYDLQMK